MRSFYQDRLGTNIGKALKTQTTAVFWQVSTNLHVIETRECKEPSGAKNGIFFEVSLWLSRACLGKMTVFI